MVGTTDKRLLAASPDKNLVMNAPTLPRKARNYELDWLRVLSILAVFFFHTGRFFDPDDWHVKNPTIYPGLLPPAMVIVSWIMPLIFVISGASTFYALGKRSGATFLKDRALRLLAPLLVCVFSHGAWQVYLERRTHDEFTGSFLAFVPHYFEGFYGLGGNFAWMGMHLWYLLLLFVFSLIFLPLFLWLRQGSGQRPLERLGRVLAFPGGVYLLAMPVMLLLATLNPASLLGARNFANWAIIPYMVIFLNGFVIVSNERLYDGVRRVRWPSAILAALLTVSMLVLYLRYGEPVYGTVLYSAMFAAYGLMSWAWIMMILGFAAQHLRFATPFLAYANEAVLPFYIMHQTVLLTVGYVIIGSHLQMPDLLTWLVITTWSLATCLGTYEFLIRRHNVLRVLFGMKPSLRQPLPQLSEPQPVH
jgi:peptidoglycan/LPS O-acetylase OafA/YrhL